MKSCLIILIFFGIQVNIKLSRFLYEFFHYFLVIKKPIILRNINERVNIEQLTKMDNERGTRLDLRWWSNYVEVSVKLVISGLRMNGFSRMICQLVKLPLGEQCLSSWRRGLGTRRLSTSTPLPPPTPPPSLVSPSG